MTLRLVIILCLGLAIAGPAQTAARIAAGDLSLIAAYEAPKGLAVDGAPFGGVSGIDYDRATGLWLLISDDKSDKAPARFYTARLDIGSTAGRRLDLLRQTPLRRDDGATFPSTQTGPGERADAEALRLDPLNGQIIWSSEGDPGRGFDPALRRMTPDGAFLARIPLLAQLAFDPSGASGARPNATIEGLSFSPDGRALWLSMEAPLIQDGPASSLRAGGLARISRLDREGRVQAQYAYRLDPIQAAAARRSDNGISEILALDDHQLLVLERSGIEDADGHFTFHCRLYAVDVRGGQDVAAIPSLAVRPVRPLVKRLLLNFDRLAGVPASNLEAMAWGPDLPDGGRTLVLAADDNFDALQRGQVLVLGVASPRSRQFGRRDGR